MAFVLEQFRLETWKEAVLWQYLFKAFIALVDTLIFYAGAAVFQRWIAAGPASQSVTS